MNAKDIKDIIEKISKTKIGVESRKQNIVELKSVYCKVCRDFGGGKKGLTYKEIGDEIGLHHATVIYHCRNTFKIVYQSNEMARSIYNHFSNEEDVLCITDTYKEKYKDLLAKYNILENEPKNGEFYDIIKEIPEDRKEMFLSRLKPMVKMVCNAKFY